MTDANQIVIQVSLGQNSVTVVFGADFLGQIVTGDLGQALATLVDAGDCDGDGDIDILDFAQLQECITGSVGPVDPPVYPIGAGSCCSVFDFDADGDLDLEDYAVFRERVTGPW